MPSDEFYEEAFFTGKMIDRAVKWCMEREGNVIDVMFQGIWRRSGEPVKGSGLLINVYSRPLKKYVVVMLNSGVRGKSRLENGAVVTVGGLRSKCDVQAVNLVLRNRLKKSTLQLRFFSGDEGVSAIKWLRKNLPLRRIHCRVEGVWLRSGADFVGEGEVLVAERGFPRKFFVTRVDKGLVGGREVKDVVVSVAFKPPLMYHLKMAVRTLLSFSVELCLRRMVRDAYLLLSSCGLGVFLNSDGAARVRSLLGDLAKRILLFVSKRNERAGFDVAAAKVIFEPKQEKAPSNDYVLVVRGLKVSYGDKTVLRDVSFSLKEGEILGIVGESGSGKTTCMKALIGEIPFDSGEVLICGFPPSRKDAVAPLIGFVPQDLSRMYGDFTPLENIVYFGRQYGIPEDELIRRGKRILKELEIFHKGNDKVETLSGGEKRRVSIAIALVHHPKILFLDEPTSGLDLVRRHELWSYLEKINKTYGTTLVVITHYPSEAEYCDRVAVFLKDKGFVDFGTPKELISKLPGKGYAVGLVLEEDNPEADYLIKSTEGVAYTFRVGPYYKILIEGGDNRAVLNRILNRLSSRGIKVYKVEPRVELTFEDYFRYITGGQI